MTSRVGTALLLLGCTLLSRNSVDAEDPLQSPLWDDPGQSVFQHPSNTFFKERDGGYELDYHKVKRAVMRRRKPARCKGDIILDEIREAGCQIRTTLAEVPRPVHMFPYPQFVEVQRCTGHCHGSVTCQATDFTNKTVQVLMFDVHQAKPPVCTKVEVEQHARCACTCSVKKTHCFRNQYYDPVKCRCRCYTEKERFHCAASTNHIWDDKLCQCECKLFFRCPYMLEYFDVTFCSCRSIYALGPEPGHTPYA
ncbi:platelet-derived growth factor subunit A-like [Ornithodoros turicata]|uniref:platelet-derived growth factor subunit A-like n=1 Tax=Ornithodoros turicata TaxID=34597 RepID=UPI003138B166